MQAGKGAPGAGGDQTGPDGPNAPAGPSGELAGPADGTDWDYAPAPESRDIVTLAPEYGLFLNGEFVPAAGRAKYLYRIARVLQERAREFAVLESLDNGKPIKESRDVDVPLAAAHFFYHAGWADKLEYAGLGPSPRPVGVAGQVIPWNFPLLMAAWKLAPALAAGNTCVLKPAETTPLTALLLAEVCQQAGLPPELGGKAANVVFDDAPVEAAVEGIVNGIFFNQGHVCCAGSRLLVQE